LVRIEPFQIDVPQTTLVDLKARLVNTRWPDFVPGSPWEQGTDLGYLREIHRYWIEEYDWRRHEAELNRLPQFMTKVDGVDIHFVHSRGKGPHPTPIVLTHGWPDSFYRFYKVIPMLTDPEKYGGDPRDSFDVVVPSLPGFGFSSRVPMPGNRIADLWEKLMTEHLGYARFGAAGGDLATWVTRSLAARYPHRVIGIHLTDVDYPSPDQAASMGEPVRQLAAAMQRWLYTDGGYWLIQSTKPQTLAYGLTDSPMGLAAWILDKFRSWSDCNGELESRFTKDELLTNIMIYWVTHTFGSSARMYYENNQALRGSTVHFDQRGGVPAGVAAFPKDLAPLPREWAEHMVDLKRFTVMPRGGHFAALEEPDLFTNDLRAFFREVTTGK